LPTFKVAIVGAGPAGYFAAQALNNVANDERSFAIDMFERLPTPWGLVRSGVAPDHPKIKTVSKVFEKIATGENFRLLANVEIGEDISVVQLQENYDAVIIATGTSLGKTLGIPGEDPRGVPISVILFGSRRKTTIPLVVQARNWEHGVFMATTLSSETTAAATGVVGVARRNPFAMLPFIGYHVGDYICHWLKLGKAHDPEKLPKIFYVNWFRRRAKGVFLWPGFGENSRIIKWAIEQVEGANTAVAIAIVRVPAPGALDVLGLDVTSGSLAIAFEVNKEEWLADIPLIEKWFAKIGPKLPAEMSQQLELLKNNLKII
jgi:hypothetical protein